MNNAQRPIDMKREEFRRYLERTGVLDAVTKTFTHLYEQTEKPADALSFVYNYIGESFPEKAQKIEILEKELSEERVKVKELTEELEAIKKKVVALEQAENVKGDDAMLEEDLSLSIAPAQLTVEPMAPTASDTTAEVAPAAPNAVESASIVADTNTEAPTPASTA